MNTENCYLHEQPKIIFRTESSISIKNGASTCKNFFVSDNIPPLLGKMGTRVPVPPPPNHRYGPAFDKTNSMNMLFLMFIQENLVLEDERELNLSPGSSSVLDSSLTICSTVGQGTSGEDLDKSEHQEKSPHQLHTCWNLNNAILND